MATKVTVLTPAIRGRLTLISAETDPSEWEVCLQGFDPFVVRAATIDEAIVRAQAGLHGLQRSAAWLAKRELRQRQAKLEKQQQIPFPPEKPASRGSGSEATKKDQAKPA